MIELKTQGLPSTVSKDIDYSYLVFVHLQRLGDLISEIERDNATSEKRLINFRNQVSWFETLLTPFLDKLYYEKYKEFGVPAGKVPLRTKDLSTNMRYFDKVNKWCQLLVIYAYNNRLLRVRKRFIPLEEIEGFIGTGELIGLEK